MSDYEYLTTEDTQQLLERLNDWRKGICPNGLLATERCFVLKKMPKIRKIINNLDDVTTEIVSESIWIDHLIKSSAITTMNDDSLIQSLSQLYVLFHSANTLKTQTTLHSIQLDKYAVFNVDDILRPTESLETAIQGIFHQSDTSIRWALLLSLWDKFGYFWPRKIILGNINIVYLSLSLSLLY